MKNRRWIAALALAFLIVPMLACGSSTDTAGAETAARAFCAHLAADEMDAAYDMTNEQLRRDATREAFASSMRSQRGVVGHTSTDLEAGTSQVGCGGRPSEIVVRGTITSADVTRRIDLHMQHDGSEWKVGEMNLHAVGE